MTRDIEEVPPSTTVSTAARLMAGRRIRHLLVTASSAGEPSRIVGILSRYDIARAFPPEANPFAVDPPIIVRPVSEIMSRPVHTVDADTAIEDAAGIMVHRACRALPVLDGGRLVGMLTETDVVRALQALVGADRGGVRIAFTRTADEDVLAQVAEWARDLRLHVSSFADVSEGEKRLAVFRVHGPDEEAFIDRVRRSGHTLLSITRGRGTA